MERNLVEVEIEHLDGTKTIVNGIRIPSLPKATNIENTDLLIIETVSGTKSATLQQLLDSAKINIQEVVDARTTAGNNPTTYVNLKSRLDANDRTVEEILTEVINARGNHLTLESHINELIQNITNNKNSINNLEQITVRYRQTRP